MLIHFLIASTMALLIIVVIGLFTELHSLQSRFHSLSLMNKTLSAAALEKEKRLTSLKTRISELEHQSAQTSSDLDTSHRLINDYLGQIDHLNARLDKLTRSQREMQDRIDDLIHQKDDLASRSQELDKMAKESAVYADKQSSRCTALEEQITLQKSLNRTLAAELHDLLQKNEIITREHQFLAADQSRLQKELQKALAAQDMTEERLHWTLHYARQQLAALYMPPDQIDAFFAAIEAGISSQISLETALDIALG